MPTHKTGISRQQKLNFSRDIIKANGYPSTALSTIRGKLLPAFYKELLDWIKATPTLSAKVFTPARYPNTLSFKFQEALTSTDITREVRWAGAYLAVHSADVQTFIDLSSRFSDALLLNKFDEGERALDDIENQFGQSLWLVKARIALLQISKGLDAQKRYYNHLSQTVLEEGMIGFIAYCISWRNEGTTSTARFSAEVKKLLSDFQFPSEIDAYLHYHIYPHSNWNVREIADILRYESIISLVDFYEAFIAVSQKAIRQRYTEALPGIRSALELINRKIKDDRVGTMLFRLTGQMKTRHEADRDAYLAFDCFLRGKYEEASSAVSRSLLASPSQFDLIELAARIAYFYNEKLEVIEAPILKQIIAQLGSVIAKDDKFSLSVMELTKISLNLYSFSWAVGLYEVLFKEISDEPLEYSLDYLQAATSATPFINPLRINSISMQSQRETYAELVLETYGQGLFTSYSNAVAGKNIDVALSKELTKEEYLLLQANRDIEAQNFLSALKFADDLIDTKYLYYRVRAIRIKCYAMLHLGDISECIGFMSTIFVADMKSHVVMPIGKAIEALTHDPSECEKAEISRPILYDMYSKFISTDYDHYRSYAYEDFLFAHKIERPSEMKDHLENFDLKKVIYFLRYICTEAVMQVSTVFSGSKELADERLAVLGLLTEVDSDNAETYQSEKKDILRRQMVQRRMKEVEQSKIYVDIESIKRTAHKDLRENYNRYISFLKNHIQVSEKFFSALKEATIIHIGENSLVALMDSTSEAFNEMLRDVPGGTSEIFKAMIREVRDQFVWSTDHGLVKYLSVRIRHGALSNQLRSPLEIARLITQRDGTTDTYKPNAYWIEQLEITDEQAKDTLILRLGTFSQQFDNFVDYMLANWISIKKSEEDVGLFNFTISANDMNSLMRKIEEATPFETFLEYVFLSLRQRLDKSLEVIRHTLQVEGKSQLNQMLNELQAEIGQLQNKFDIGPINNAIASARTELQTALNRIINWFTLSRSTNDESFLIEDMIEISAKMVQTFARSFTYEIYDRPLEKLELPGSYFTIAEDIFRNIFENIINHSGLNDAPKAHIQIIRSEQSITFTVENDLGFGKPTPEALEHLENIKRAIKNGQFSTSVTSEGGTGFHKVYKILSHDFNTNPDLDFGFSNGRFFVSFSIPHLDVLP